MHDDDTVARTAASPFHSGERAVQARAGTREACEAIGGRMLRDFMPEQHRTFFPKLPFIVAGGIDARGVPAATLLAGAPGFASSPHARRLRVDALPPIDDPLVDAIRPGAAVGLLGIELPTRRRNRANGRVASVDTAGFDVDVAQSFGNCPKYIQSRDLEPGAGEKPGETRTASRVPAARVSGRIDAPAAALIEASDTFFVATSSGATSAPADAPRSLGVDVSHRGGRPGFVQVGADGTLTWPDFAGNGLFNTLGNLVAFPRAGLVFVDFAQAGLLHVSGRAEIVWSGADVDRFAGAERLVRLHVERVVLRPGALPWRWRLVEVSPALDGTGRW
jgi:hypothetical protein